VVKCRQMQERNLCKEMGCKAACCRDAYFINSYSTREIKNLFPEAKKVMWLSIQTKNGVYFDSFLGRGTLRIVGPCPNLDSQGNCSIYDARPKDCQNLGMGSDDCLLFRRVHEQDLKISSEEFTPFH